MDLTEAQTAVLCELIVRGPQTVGELRGRANRMHAFDELSQVEVVLTELGERDTPAVKRLARQPGRKESRYAHLLAGAIEDADDGDEAERPLPAETATLEVRAENERVERLEESVESLRGEVAELQLQTFRQQFE
jgi:hypothetical protein